MEEQLIGEHGRAEQPGVDGKAPQPAPLNHAEHKADGKIPGYTRHEHAGGNAQPVDAGGAGFQRARDLEHRAAHNRGNGQKK